MVQATGRASGVLPPRTTVSVPSRAARSWREAPRGVPGLPAPQISGALQAQKSPQPSLTVQTPPGQDGTHAPKMLSTQGCPFCTQASPHRPQVSCFVLHSLSMLPHSSQGGQLVSGTQQASVLPWQTAPDWVQQMPSQQVGLGQLTHVPFHHRSGTHHTPVPASPHRRGIH